MTNFEALRGFSLIEALLVLLLLGVVMASAAPSFSHLLQHYHMTQQVAAIASLLANARSETLARQEPLYVHKVSDAHTWRIGLFSTESAPEFSMMPVQAISMVEGATLELDSTHDSAGFSHRHGRPLSAGHYRLSYPSEAQAIKVVFHNISGRVRICSEPEDAYGYPAC